MLQEAFASAGAGAKSQLFVFDKSSEKTFRTSPENVLKERDFNTFEADGVTYCLEEGFGQIEDRAAPVFRKIIEARSLAGLSDEETAAILVFVALQKVRGTNTRASMTDMFDQIRERIRAEGQDAATVSQIGAFDDPEEVKLSALSLVGDNLGDFAKSYTNKVMILLEAVPRETFLLGDTPVVLANHNDTYPYGNLGLEVVGIEIYMPIAPNLTLAFWCPSIVEMMGAAHLATIAKVRLLEPLATLGMGPQANAARAALPEARQRMAKVGADLEAINAKSPLITDGPHMEYLNSLQVGQAERYVLSSTGDFTFVKRMISDNPRYKRGLRANLA